jgi:tRNA-Thr(GGU) m(6)t(6)A37 methyltransferase TsaA
VDPVGVVRSPRSEATDDDWGEVVSTITLDAERYGPEALAGLADFSHVEVVYMFDRVGPDEIEVGSRHPRGNPEWPRVGIFAQRARGRPNRIAVSVCRLLGVDGLSLHVVGLDAIDGTPVLDVKPYMEEFGPRGEVHQPGWSHELMAGYWKAP